MVAISAVRKYTRLPKRSRVEFTLSEKELFDRSVILNPSAERLSIFAN